MAPAFIATLAAFILLPRIHENPVLLWSFASAAIALFVWYVILRRSRRKPTIEISLRPQHYLQAVAHTMIFVYWSMYWPPIGEAAPLIAAQIVFAYGFDSLLSWARRGKFVLGFGPFPIIYSTNLFLRFRDDWFYYQFLMVAIGLLAKELFQWHRDGRRVHIFNPSSFPLALFSLALIVTGTSSITWAEEIATLLILPPNIYLFIFLVALPGQFLFGVSSMTLPAVLTTYAFSMLYLAVTGTYFFFDSNVPIAVFLGMHLLFTDPSTSPKTELGRILFGVCYGLSVVVLYVVLDAIGAPTYYDKLLQVPIMNLLVKQFDAIGRARSMAWINPARVATAAAPHLRHVGYATLWTLTFVVLFTTGGLANNHPGQSSTFWAAACAEGRSGSCDKLAVVHERDCGAGSTWACNELGIVAASRRVATRVDSMQLFELSCARGVPAACENAGLLRSSASTFRHADPRFGDYLIILRGGRGPIAEGTALEVFTRACRDGFVAGCASVGDVFFQGDGVAKDQPRAIKLWEEACERGHAGSCSNLAVMHRMGDGVPQDDAMAVRFMQRACDLGSTAACRTLALP